MPLVKASSAARADAFSFVDVERQAADTLAAARRQADEVLARARREAEAIRQRAAEQGHEEGHAEGLAAGREEGAQAGRQEAFDQQAGELRQFAATLAAALAELELRHHALADAAADHVTRLALAVAEKITRRLGVIDPAVLRENVAAAAKLVTDAHAVRLAVHPEHAAALTDALPLLGVEWPALRDAEIVPDESIAPGGCRLSAAGGLIDADLQTQLDRLTAELLPDPDPPANHLGATASPEGEAVSGVGTASPSGEAVAPKSEENRPNSAQMPGEAGAA